MPSTLSHHRCNDQFLDLMAQQPTDRTLFPCEYADFDDLLNEISDWSPDITSEDDSAGVESSAGGIMQAANTFQSSVTDHTLLSGTHMIREDSSAYQASPFEFQERGPHIIGPNTSRHLNAPYSPWFQLGAASPEYINMNALGTTNIISAVPMMANCSVGNAGFHKSDESQTIMELPIYAGYGWGGSVNGPYIDNPGRLLLPKNISTQMTPEGMPANHTDPPLVPLSRGVHPEVRSAEKGSETILSPTRPLKKRPRSPSSEPPPRNTLHIIHDERSMPRNFRANPEAHGRYAIYPDGTRKYLNAPKVSSKRRQPTLVEKDLN